MPCYTFFLALQSCYRPYNCYGQNSMLRVPSGLEPDICVVMLFYRIKQSCRNSFASAEASSLRTQRQLLRGYPTPTRHRLTVSPSSRLRSCLSIRDCLAKVLCLPEPPTFVGCGRGGRQTKDNNHNILPLPLSTLLPHGVEWICHVKIPKLKIKTKTMSELLTGHGSHVL